MKRLAIFSAILLTGPAIGFAWADGPPCGCHGKLCHCMRGEPASPDCTPPCEQLRIGPLCTPEHTQKLIDSLANAADCCERIKAAKKLGCCLHANFCCNSEVLHALVHALTCDPCWKVRKAAAWSIAYQKARVPEGVAALYIASRLDHHYLVRDAANDALAVLLPAGRACFKDLLLATDVLIARVRDSYDPTNGHFPPNIPTLNRFQLILVFEHCCRVSRTKSVAASKRWMGNRAERSHLSSHGFRLPDGHLC